MKGVKRMIMLRNGNLREEDDIGRGAKKGDVAR
jgi:hypothetical protein